MTPEFQDAPAAHTAAPSPAGATDPSGVAPEPDLLWTLVLLPLGLYGCLGLLGRLSRTLAPRHDLRGVRWRPFDLLAVVGTGVGVLLVLGLGNALLGASTKGEAPVLLALVETAFLMASMGVAAAFLAVRRAGRPGLASLGLAAGGDGRAALLGAGCYVLFLPLLFLGFALWPHLAERFGIPIQAQEVLVEVLSLRGVALAFAMVLAVPVVPFFEELVFRGFLQSLLTQRYGTVAAVLLTSLVFASLHGASAFGPIFLLSLFLGWLRARTDQLACSWAAHALHNALTLSFVLTVSP